MCTITIDCNYRENPFLFVHSSFIVHYCSLLTLFSKTLSLFHCYHFYFSPYTARLEEGSEKYWFGLTQDDITPPFYMTYDPMTSNQMLDLQPRPSESTLPYWMNRKELIPVTTYRNRKFYGLSQQYAPKNVTL